MTIERMKRTDWRILQELKPMWDSTEKWAADELSERELLANLEFAVKNIRAIIMFKENESGPNPVRAERGISRTAHQCSALDTEADTQTRGSIAARS